MIKKPKIAVIGLKGLPAFGGAASVGESLINELMNEYHFYVYSVSTHTSPNSKSNSYTQIVFPGKNVNGMSTFLYYIKSMLHCLFLANYDLIHLHHSESGFITPFLRLKYKVIVTIHGVFTNKIDPKFSGYINKFFRFSEKMNMLFANNIISVSKTDKIFCEKKFNRRIEYVPNGIFKVEKAILEKNYDFLFVAARIYEIKGLHLLLKAMKHQLTNKKLLVIGDMNQDLDYKKYILELSKGLNVEFIPLIKEKDNLFSYILQSKIFIFPSLFEAMSMILLEVVSLKVPVLASDIEANKNIFNENEINYFHSNDFNDLANEMSFCLKNESLIQEKVKKAYNKLINSYTWDIIANRYSEIYSELLG